MNVDELNRFLEEGNQVNTEPNISQRANNFVEEVVSEYTGESSLIHYSSARFENEEHVENEARVENDETAIDHTQLIQTDVDQVQARENFDADYISPYPSTSSANYNIANIQLSNQPNDLAASSDSRRFISSATRRAISTAVNVNSSSTDISSERQRNTLTRPASKNTSFVRPNPPPSKATAPHQKKVAQSTCRSDFPATPDTPAPPTGTATSNENKIEMIRRKMDSCLNAMQNKITDKAQRSPHAPFLAYLGTKLVNVPNEIISSVEEEILEIVKYYSRQ